jgi:hypothetical protein
MSVSKSYRIKRDQNGNINVPLLIAAVKDPKRGFYVKDRKYRTKTYQACFVADAAVGWLKENVEGTSSNEEAVAIGQLLVDQGVIEHVSEKSKPFKNEYLFFRYAYHVTEFDNQVRVVLTDSRLCPRVASPRFIRLEMLLSMNLYAT